MDGIPGLYHIVTDNICFIFTERKDKVVAAVTKLPGGIPIKG